MNTCARFLAAAVLVFVYGCGRENAPAEPESPPERAAAAAGNQAQVEQLVLVNRMLASREMAVLRAYGHASVRSSSRPDRYFISRAVSPALVTAGDIYESDLDGAPVSGSSQRLYEDRFIHGEIYKARPDVSAIVYTKATALVAFSVSSVPLPTNLLRPGSPPVPVFDIRRVAGGEEGVVNSAAVASALANALGTDTQMLIFGNGAVVAGADAGSVVNAALDLRTGADNRVFELAVGGTARHMVYTRTQAIPEAGGSEDTGPSGRVERINRFAAYFNHLGARELARVPGEPAAAAADANSDQALMDELVIANRLLASDDIGVLTPDGVAHASVRSRTNPDHYFIARDVAPGMVTTEAIIENDLDSVPVREDQRVFAQYSERYIHGEIYKARPDILAIVHAHTPELVTFGQSSVRLRPVLSSALFIGQGLPIYDLTTFTGGAPSPVSCAHCVSTPQLGRALAEVMGAADGSLMLDHGMVLGAASLPALVSRAYNLRLNAQVQSLAIRLGGTVGAFEVAPSSAAATGYPEWNYWTQTVLGSSPAVDVNVAYRPQSGLSTRRD